MLYIIIFISAISAALGQILLKIGSTEKQSLAEFINTYNILGCFCYLIGLLLWIYSLSKLPLSIVYVFTMITFVLVYIFSHLLLKESLSWFALIGIGFIILGFLFIALGQSRLTGV